MKDVTQGYIDAWARKDGKEAVVYLQYKRRYYNGSAYVYESNWTQMTMRDYFQVGQINWKLDVPLLNTIRASNVSLKLKNTDYEWVEQNTTSGIFKPDATATTGYDPFLMKWQVLIGYKRLNDGVIELATVFTGVAVDYIFDTQSGWAEVSVSGNEYLLQAADAQLVSTAFSENLVGTVNGSNKVFTSTSTGVWRVPPTDGITDNSVDKIQGTDYTLSGLNTYNGVVTVTFTTAPTTGTPTINGDKWYTVQTIEALVAALCEQAGITAAYRTIAPAIIPGVSSRITINAAAQWQAYALNNTDPYIIPDSIAIGYRITNNGFESGDFTGWTAENSSTAHVAASSSVQSSIVYSGTYAAKLGINYDSEVGSSSAYACFVQDDGFEYGNVAITLTGGWQQITLSPTPGAPTSVKLRIVVVAGSGAYSRITSSQYVSSGAGSSETTFWVHNGNSGTTINYRFALAVDDVSAHGMTDTGDFTTTEFDLGAAPTGWGALVASGALNGGGWTFQTQTATSSGGSYSSLQDLDGDNVPQSPLRQFLKIKGLFTAASGGANGPVLASITLPFTTSVVQLAMADFSGQTCFDAIQGLAQLCDYEFGFDGDGNFFFRAKSVSPTPIVTLNQNDGITRIIDFRPGYDAVINVGQVKYNDYYAEYNSSSLPEAAPSSQARFLTRVRSESIGFLLVYDANLANGRAQLIHDNNCRTKRRSRIVSKIIPFADLSDVISYSYMDRPIQVDSVFGDPVNQWPPVFGTPMNVLARDVPGKLTGMMLDPNTLMGEYETQEVLS